MSEKKENQDLIKEQKLEVVMMEGEGDEVVKWFVAQ